ncbi:Protein FAM92A [Hondaea fermentalgiana]|uniref:Protein FAM92A n=1 Tax=Hondaea fermentalgiana TaxID=2315210 RepID=A0A2R5GP23_9STRA|nr:Protein FAM92A [Hondaea fermentalgiana]|eukprot:GBG32622.1 Protein FAM92A [Hondaea fermentalgiana]
MDPSNDERAAVMSDRLHTFRKNCALVQAKANGVIKSEAAATKQYVALAESLMRMARGENNRNLRQAVAATADALSEIEGHRETLILDRVQSSLVQKINDMDENCNAPTELLLRDRNRSIKSSVKFKEQFATLANKPATSQSKLEKKRNQLQDEEKRMYTIDKSLQQNLIRYEEKRVQDAQSAFEDFVKGQLLYHCRAIETLTAALKSVQRVDPASSVDQLCNDLHIKDNRPQPQAQTLSQSRAARSVLLRQNSETKAQQSP